MKFLLDGKTWPGAGAVEAPRPASTETLNAAETARVNAVLAHSIPDYIAQTEDYGIRIEKLKNEAMEGGYQDVYLVEHKRHKVVASNFTALPHTLTYLQQIQEHLNEALGKGQLKQ